MEKSRTVTHIVNAPTVEPNTFPWHVGIYRKFKDANGETDYDQICGGSILYSYIVVSGKYILMTASLNMLKKRIL